MTKGEFVKEEFNKTTESAILPAIDKFMSSAVIRRILTLQFYQLSVNVNIHHIVNRTCYYHLAVLNSYKGSVK